MGAGQRSLVQEKGQVTIPADIRRRLRLRKGSYVAFVETDEGVMIVPEEDVAMDALDEIGQALRERGISLDELIDSGRSIRGELLKERYGLTDPDA